MGRGGGQYRGRRGGPVRPSEPPPSSPARPCPLPPLRPVGAGGNRGRWLRREAVPSGRGWGGGTGQRPSAAGLRRHCGPAPAPHRAPPAPGTGLHRERPRVSTGPGSGSPPGAVPGFHRLQLRRPGPVAAPQPPPPGSAERGHRHRPRTAPPGRSRDGTRWYRRPLAPGRHRAGGRGHLAGGGGRGLPVVRGQERLLAPRLRLRVLHLLLRHVPPAVLLPRPTAPPHRAPAAPLPRLQSQDHRGHRLGRGAFHRHRHHHRLLLHVLLLLPLPAPAEPPHPPARPGDPTLQLPPRGPPSPFPHGPQSRPSAPPARFRPHGHVPTTRSHRPVPALPLRPPRLQPHSTSTLRPSTAQLSRSLSIPPSPGTLLPPPASGDELGTIIRVSSPPPGPGGCPQRGRIGPFPGGG